MQDYEATVFLSLEKLKEKHVKEFEELKIKTQNDFKIKQKLSKDILEKRKKVRLLMGMKKYDEAEIL
jgi:hypothetical protein